MKSLTQLNSEIADIAQRRKLRAHIQRLLNKWTPRLGVNVQGWDIKKLKTYWASVNERAGKMTFNQKLAEMPPAFVEVTVVHELVHMLTDGHDAKFCALMDKHLPNWRRWHDRYAGTMTRHS